MKTGLLLIAHGSREAAANADLEHVAEQLRQRGYEIAVAAYLELAEAKHRGRRRAAASNGERNAW